MPTRSENPATGSENPATGSENQATRSENPAIGSENPAADCSSSGTSSLAEQPRADQAMDSVLTSHVRDFSGSSDPAGKILPALKRLLRRHMRRRNLMAASPAALGYRDVRHWSAPGAFEDIVTDCYLFAILKRLTALQDQLKVKPNVDGLISRNVANFLRARQRRHDPIGYAVFGNVKRAALEAAAGAAALDNFGRKNLHCESVIRLQGGDRTLPAADIDLVDAAIKESTGWDNALPYLTEVTDNGRKWVLDFLGQLKSSGVAAVRCGDLVNALARRVRAEWMGRHGDSAADLGREEPDDLDAALTSCPSPEGSGECSLVRMVWPDEGLDARERWERLKRLIPERIARFECQKRVRERLVTVFEALVQAVEEGGREPPTQAELVQRTGMARATLSDAFRLLQKIILEFDPENPVKIHK
jgi:hypothetical protein